jgi:phospholipid/cholesterol/gamma-HCH transport system ATP-binding protein
MVEVKGLVVRFDERTVLDGIDLHAAPGETLAIMGSSGGGKTTLLRCIAGLLRPTEGTVKVDGIDVVSDPEGARKRMGMVFQSAALFDYMSVKENVLFGIDRQLRLTGKARHDLADKALGQVGLEPSDAAKMPSELSGGMRKRVGVARALALGPKLMLYDEPTTGLDPITAYTIDSLIASLRKESDVTSIVVSHDVSSVMRVADRIGFLHQGRLIFDGTPDEFEDSREPSIRELVDKARATSLE